MSNTNLTGDEIRLLHTLADAFVLLAGRVTECEALLDQCMDWMLLHEEPYAQA